MVSVVIAKEILLYQIPWLVTAKDGVIIISLVLRSYTSYKYLKVLRIDTTYPTEELDE